MAVTVIASGNSGIGASWADYNDPHGTGAGTRLINRIPGASFVTGHRYFLFYKVMVQGTFGRTKAEIRHGGTEIAKLSGTKAGSTSNYCYKQISGIDIITGDSTKDLDFVATYLGTGTSQYGDDQILLIDLDTPGFPLVEGTDWFYDEDSSPHPNPGNTYTSSFGASVGFIPDSVSDYLVFGDIHWSPSSGPESMRLYDQTASVEMGSVSYGVGNIGAEESKHVVMAVLETPTVNPQIVRTQYKSLVSDKDNAQIFILRLNALASYGFSQVDINNNSGGWEGTSFLYTPDATGDVVLLGETKGWSGGATFPEQNYGVLGRTRYDGSTIGQNVGYLITPSSDYAADNRFGASFANLLTGQSGEVTVGAEINSNQSNPAFIKKRQQTIVAFGTDKAFSTETVTTGLDIYFTKTSAVIKSRNSVTSATTNFERLGVEKGDVLVIKAGPNTGSYVIRDVVGNVLFLEQSLPSGDQGPVEADIRKSRDIAAYQSAAVVISQPTFSHGVGTYAVLDMMVV